LTQGQLLWEWGVGGLDDVEGEAALELHAGCAEDGPQGTRGAALFPDDFSYIAGCNVKPENDGLWAGNEFDPDCFGVIHQSPRNFGQQSLHLGDSSVRIKTIM